MQVERDQPYIIKQLNEKEFEYKMISNAFMKTVNNYGVKIEKIEKMFNPIIH